MFSKGRRDREKRLSREAIAWLIKLRDSNGSSIVVANWQKWHDQSQQHRDVYKRVALFWNMFDMEELSLDCHEVERDLARRKASDHSGRGFGLIRSPWIPVYQMAAAALGMVALVAAILFYSDLDSVHSTQDTNVVEINYSTDVGEHRSWTLSDGSELFLGGRTEVVIQFGDQARNVFMGRGEALFEVARQADIPFTVHVGESTFTAIGTRFNVLSGPREIKVAVLEGVVQASLRPSEYENDATTSPYTNLVAGQSLSVDRLAMAATIRDAVEGGQVSWRSGHLTYVDQTLGLVFDDVRRYYPKPIELTETVANLRYTGAIKQDNVDEWLQVLPEVFPVNVEESGDRLKISERERQ